MKRRITLIAGLLLSCPAFCQTRDSIDCSIFTVGYDYKIHTTDKDGNAVTDSLHTVLLVGSKVSQTMGYYTHKYKVLGIDAHEYYDEYQREGMAHVPTIMTDLAEKRMDVVEAVPAYYYSYSEPNDLEWTLLDDTLSISHYLCHKAQTTYGGRTWTSWYTEEVPTTAGPWKLSGLPGLIIKADEAECTFEFEMFELTQQAIAITNTQNPNATIKTKRDKFVTMRNKLFLDKRYVEDPLYYWTRTDNVSTHVEIYGSLEDYKKKNGTRINDSDITYMVNGIAVPLYIKTRTHYQPLELE